MIRQYIVFLFMAATLCAHAQRDSLALVLGTGFGYSLEPLDEGDLNAALSAASLPHIGNTQGMFRVNFFASGRRTFFDFATTFRHSTDYADSSTVRTDVTNIQFSYGYPIIRTARTLLTPTIGYRFASLSYAYSVDPADPAFSAVLQSGAGGTRLAYSRSELAFGASYTYGKNLCLSASAGYLVPLGNGSWRESGSGTKLQNGPTVDPGFFIGIGIGFRLDLRPWSLPSC